MAFEHYVPMDVKATLPFPYNLDLSPILHGLARRTPIGRRRLANDPVTAAYLAAGMRLLERQIDNPSCLGRSESDESHEAERPLLRLLSQRAVSDEVANNPDPFVKVGSTSTLRATWISQPHYIADLLRFGLWSERYLGMYTEDLTAHVENLVTGPLLIDAIRFATHANIVDSVERPRFRLQLLAAATAKDDTVIRQAMTDNYQGVEETWLPIFAEMIEARGLKLRPGVSLKAFNSLMVAAIEGISLRAIADENAEVYDPAEGTSIAALFGMALLLGCKQRASEEDEVSLEKAVQDLVYGANTEE
jgi:hypothetical protein